MTNSSMAIWLALCLMSPALADLPPDTPKPGGIAVIDIGTHSTPPNAFFGDRQTLVLQEADRWYAIVGVPLAANVGPASVRVQGTSDRNVEFEVVPHEYREQHLEVTRKYVEPDAKQLERILGERRIIDRALNNFRAAAPASLRLASPVPGRRSDSFGFRRFFNGEARAPHSGMDIAANVGTPVVVPQDGIVAATGNYFFNGLTVIVDHGQGFVTLYCHLERIDVAAAETVSAGDVLGTVGATGRVTGAHLHFGTYLNGTAIDPALLLQSAP